MGTIGLQVFISLLIVLGAVLVALIVDLLKGRNERLREANAALRAQQEESDRREILLERMHAEAVGAALDPAQFFLSRETLAQVLQSVPLETIRDLRELFEQIEAERVAEMERANAVSEVETVPEPVIEGESIAEPVIEPLVEAVAAQPVEETPAEAMALAALSDVAEPVEEIPFAAESAEAVAVAPEAIEAEAIEPEAIDMVAEPIAPQSGLAVAPVLEELAADAPALEEAVAEAQDSGKAELTLEPMRLEIGEEPDDVVRIRVIRNAEEVLPESAISAERSPIVIEDVVVAAGAEAVAEAEPEIAAVVEEPVVAEAEVVEPLVVEPVVEVEPEIAAVVEEPVVAEAEVVEPLVVEPVVEIEPEIAAVAKEPVVAEAEVVEPLVVEPVVEVEPETAAMIEEQVVAIVTAEPEVVLPQVEAQMPIEMEAEPVVMAPAEILDLSPAPEFASNVIEMPASILAPIEEVQTAEVLSLEDDSSELKVPAGFQDAVMLESLCEQGKPFTGFAVVVGPLDYPKMISDVGQSETDRLMTDVTRTVLDLARPQDFIAKTADDEFVILYVGETGVASQRRSHSISEKIWDFQLRALGSYSVVLTWGGSQGEQEPLRAVVENAREQMLESRRGRKSMVSSGAGRFRRITPASA